MDAQYLILERQYQNLKRKYERAHAFIEDVHANSIDFVFCVKAERTLHVLKDTDQ